jgi:CheY-like chemotaxis protein
MARVLIVNDHAPFFETLSRTIEDLGHEPIGVYGGMEALKAVVDDRPDLILLDYMMPELNGIETIFRIRSSPEGKTIPIVVISTHLSFSAEAAADGQAWEPDLLDDLLRNILDQTLRSVLL